MKFNRAIIVILPLAIADARKTNMRRKLEEDTITFDDPTHHGKLVDYCLTFENDCGKPAADAYCDEKGYGEAVDYPKRQTYNEDTLTMEQHATCNPAYHTCHTFDYITCDVLEQTFDNPREHGRALDGCYEFESDCGDLAADAFCVDKGYASAKDYSMVVSQEETMTIGNHAVCDPAWHGCSTFDYITCI